MYYRNVAFDSGFQKKKTKAFTSLLPARIRRRYFRQLQPHVRWPQMTQPRSQVDRHGLDIAGVLDDNRGGHVVRYIRAIERHRRCYRKDMTAIYPGPDSEAKSAGKAV